MNIKYYLQRNRINGRECYVARVTGRPTADRDFLVREMVNRGTTLTATDIRAVLDLEEQVSADLLAQGYRIVTPLYQISLSIKGVFKSLTDRYVRSRHKIYPTISAGSGLKRLLARARIKATRVEKEWKPPLAHHFHMLFSEAGARLIAGGHGLIEGARLKFDADDPQQGVYFEPIGEANLLQRIKVEQYGLCETGKVIFKIPTLQPGMRYWLTVVGPEGEGHYKRPLDTITTATERTNADKAVSELATPIEKSVISDSDSAKGFYKDPNSTFTEPGGRTTGSDSSDHRERVVGPDD